MNQIKLNLSDPLLERRELEESARLYSQLYEQDLEGKQWVDDSARDWPR